MGSGHTRERTALIVTVRNEATTVERLLESIAAQSLQPDEVVISDGGSSDATLAIVRRWSKRLPLQLVDAAGANISRGRNLAVEATTADWIAVTDAGVCLEPDWLEQLAQHRSPDIDVVSGFFTSEPRSTFERALGATTLPWLHDIQPDSFLPSSRSVLFRRSAWRRVGGYPEWLDYCEDLVFDLALKRAGARFIFAPGAIARFRPRPTIGTFFRQYFLYARGDGKAGLWPRRHAIRYAAYATAAAVAVKAHRLRWLIAVGALMYTRRPYQRLPLDGLTPQQVVLALALPPVIRLVGDVAKMLGYPVGVGWRARRAWTSRSSS